MNNRTNKVAGGASTSKPTYNKSEYFTDLSEITVGTIFIREDVDLSSNICEITEIEDKNTGVPRKSIKYLNLSKNNKDTRKMHVATEIKANGIKKDVVVGFYGNTICYLKKPTKAQLNKIYKNRAGGESAFNLKTNKVAGGASASNLKNNKSQYFTDLSQITDGTIFIREEKFNNTLCIIIETKNKNVGTNYPSKVIKYKNLSKKNNKRTREMTVMIEGKKNKDVVVGFYGDTKCYLKKPTKAQLNEINKNRAGSASASKSNTKNKMNNIVNKLKSNGINNRFTVQSHENKFYLYNLRNNNGNMYSFNNAKNVEKGIKLLNKTKRNRFIKKKRKSSLSAGSKELEDAINKNLVKIQYDKSIDNFYKRNELVVGLEFILFSPYRYNSKNPLNQLERCVITNIDKEKNFVEFKHENIKFKSYLFYLSGEQYATALLIDPSVEEMGTVSLLRDLFYFQKAKLSNKSRNRAHGGLAVSMSNNKSENNRAHGGLAVNMLNNKSGYRQQKFNANQKELQDAINKNLVKIEYGKIIDNFYKPDELKRGLEFILFSPYSKNSKNPVKLLKGCIITNIYTEYKVVKSYKVIEFEHENKKFKSYIVNISNEEIYATAIMGDLNNSNISPDLYTDLFYFQKEDPHNMY